LHSTTRVPYSRHPGGFAEKSIAEENIFLSAFLPRAEHARHQLDDQAAPVSIIVQNQHRHTQMEFRFNVGNSEKLRRQLARHLATALTYSRNFQERSKTLPVVGRRPATPAADFNDTACSLPEGQTLTGYSKHR
jgi:hypothetical protein